MVHYETYGVDPVAIMLFLVEPMAQQWASQTCLALWLTLKARAYLTRNALAGGRKLQTWFNKQVPCQVYHLPLYPLHVVYDEIL